ncbi:MAG: sel1 repeat family protein [Magnetococcales bacterium]|nr:sel1 repeat family protein [Magnetococcales bacterium]
MPRGWWLTLLCLWLGGWPSRPSATERTDDTWYRLAAQRGNVTAQTELGAIYYYGFGVPKDPVRALFWYREAAQQGDAWAGYKVGAMLEEGQGTARDPTTAAQWYRRVALRKSTGEGETDIVGWSRLKLGFMYRDGRGVQADPGRSEKWFRLAAESGYVEALYRLGEARLRAGERVAALTWFQRAATRGHGGAFDALTRLQREFSPKQVAEAEAQAAQPLTAVATPEEEPQASVAPDS